MPKRKIEDRAFDLRQWQGECLRKVVGFVNEGKTNFLCTATPGSGKTKLALTVAHYFLKEKYCDRVVVVTPSDQLKRQWSWEAAEFAGIDLDPDYSNSQGIEVSDFHGVAITYALLGQDKKSVHAQNTFSKKTLVIFDEIHHAGESLTWGNAVKNSFENAVFRLAISGTAFRSDDAQIPFITYENKVSVADYTYSYERAIRENVCRPVYFTIHEGQMKWKVGAQEFEHTFKDSLAPDQVSKRLKTALDPKGNWVKDVLKDADRKLSEIRQTHHNAAGLVFAATQRHAQEISKVVEKITGEIPPVVISSDDDGSEKIQAFKNGNGRWLISVRMVSEGVDIPRLRVGVYLTIIKSELYFRQAVGRFVRVLKSLQSQDAFIFIPQDKDIVKLAETIQLERDHALEDAERKAGGADGVNTDLFGNDYTPALQGKFTPLGSEATVSKTIAVNVEISSGARHGVDTRRVPQNNDPVYLQKERLRDNINLLAKRYAIKLTNGNRNIRPDFKALHKEWISNGGKEMHLETIEELKNRLQFYQSKLR